jgi:hypothetical protein
MGAVLHVGTPVNCFHGATAIRAQGASRVKVGGVQVWTVDMAIDVISALCLFRVPPPPGKPQPCAKVEWTQGASRVKAGGQAVVIRESAQSAQCKSADKIPQGLPTVGPSQTRVRAT